jgi:acyl-CoA reductase-like NAD-dependent aldehyde dehydrogenase
MLTMKLKPYFALIPLLVATAGYAQSSVPSAQQVSDARAAATAATSGKAAPRQLSAEQRAELRRQLYQYNRLHGKGS